MQMKVFTLAIPALALAAFAQTDPSQSSQQETRTESQSTTTTTQEEQRPVRHARTGQETGKRTWKGTLVDASCAQNMASAGTTTSTQTTTSAERSTTESTEAKRSTESEETTREQKSQTGAERSETAAGGMAAGSHGAMHVDAKAISQSCPITSTTKDFALVTSDGRLMQLNDEGDAKVASELKTNTKWNKAINSNKRITASVRGSLEGDTLQVESVK